MIRLYHNHTGDRAHVRDRHRHDTARGDPISVDPELSESRAASQPKSLETLPRLKLHVSVAHKRGLPGFGSMGASCGLELEVDAELFNAAPEQFQARVREAYDACARAVQDELNRRGAPPQQEPVSRRDDSPCEPPLRPSTPAQARALRRIAQRRQLDLDDLVRRRFNGARLDGLSRVQASRLIDELQTGPADPTA